MKSSSTRHVAISHLSVPALAGRVWLFLLPVLTFGLLFRLVDIKRPFVGLHMWNEVYYVTIARNFERFGFLATYNYDWVGGLPLSRIYGPSPLVPWMIYLFSRALGQAEWVARLPILILGMCSLVVLYLMCRELYDDGVALAAAAVAAIMPGVVFFSRQVALDAPMTAFGLAAIWTLLVAQRTRQRHWLAISSALLAVAIFTKYTAVLFMPALAWIWLRMLRSSYQSRKTAWLFAAVYFLAAVLPAASWFIYGLVASAAQGPKGLDANYLNRVREWTPQAWKMAAAVTWSRFSEQVGGIFWYPLVLAGMAAIGARGARRAGAFVKQHLVVFLVIIPWFVQFVYPYSWVSNDAYTYPMLYGIAILAGLGLTRAVRYVRRLPDLSSQKLQTAVSLLAVTVCLSCILNYWQVYHAWYAPNFNAIQLPANLVTPFGDPYASAKLVRAVNTSHKPVLAEMPATLYYAQDKYWEGKAMWWWWGLDERDKMVTAIRSREFGYVVFTYQPPVVITDALAESGYRRIGPAAWEKIETSQG